MARGRSGNRNRGVRSHVIPDNSVHAAIRRSVLAVEDRREYHPEGRNRPPGALTREARRLVIKPKVQRSNVGWRAFPPFQVGFWMPDFVAVCVRRKQRREVMHAKRLAGRRGSGGSRRSRNFFSDVVC